MVNTVEFFNMELDQLLIEGNEYGYTKEECKIYDEGLKVHFCEDMEEYKEEKEDIILWYKNKQGLDLKNVLETINKRVAMIFN